MKVSQFATRRLITAALIGGALVAAPLFAAPPGNQPPQQNPHAPLFPDLVLADKDGAGAWIWGANVGSRHDVPWKGKVILTAAESIDPQHGPGGGACRFHAAFFMREANHKTTGQFTNIVRSDATIVWTGLLQIFPPPLGNLIEVANEMTFFPGTHTFSVSVDDGNVVHETSETNNKNSLTYVLQGTCAGHAATGK